MAFDYAAMEAEEAPQAERLAHYLCEKFRPLSVIDLGCATGFYLTPFFRRGAITVGIDIDPIVVAHRDDNAGKNLWEGDITNPNASFGIFDLVLCLEVVEHIDPAKSEAAVSTIARCLAGGARSRIVFSAAAPGQGGDGHITCQTKGYWLDWFGLYGIYGSRSETEELVSHMKRGYHLGWLTQNVVVLHREHRGERS